MTTFINIVDLYFCGNNEDDGGKGEADNGNNSDESPRGNARHDDTKVFLGEVQLCSYTTKTRRCIDTKVKKKTKYTSSVTYLIFR